MPYRNNLLLDSLPAADRARLAPDLTEVALEPGQVLFDVGEPIRYAYFLHYGMVSLVTTMADGATVETGTVGPEGFVGFSAMLGDPLAIKRGVVLMPGTASRIPIETLLAAQAASPALGSLISRFIKALFAQTLQWVACNALHSVEQRCCRWLLLTHDRAQADHFELTQELLAQMLGVRRQGVSAVCNRLQKAGVLKYSRGAVQLLDRRGVAAAACECYRVARDSYHQCFPELTR